ncbi:MAG: PPC domain-containing DNA-binding protein [Planctomycetota bacterium]|jgi:predicted DNA-binding protein with PD1-like motif
MNIFDGMQLDEIVCVYMEHGDDFHECIQEAARQNDIQSGAILSGIGTLDRARVHYVATTGFPAENVFPEVEGPIELCSVTGIIADYEPHMHCTMALRGDELLAGHLEPGCRILYLAEVVIAKFSGRHLARDRHPELGTVRLTEK